MSFFRRAVKWQNVWFLEKYDFFVGKSITVFEILLIRSNNPWALGMLLGYQKYIFILTVQFFLIFRAKNTTFGAKSCQNHLLCHIKNFCNFPPNNSIINQNDPLYIMYFCLIYYRSLNYKISWLFLDKLFWNHKNETR